MFNKLLDFLGKPKTVRVISMAVIWFFFIACLGISGSYKDSFNATIFVIAIWLLGYNSKR